MDTMNNLHFKLILADGSEVTDAQSSWSEISDMIRVRYFDNPKTVFVCNLSVKKICVTNGELSAEIDVPEGAQVYYAIRSETILFSSREKAEQVLGNVVGLVKDGEVIEERFLNSQQNEVVGVRK